MAGYWGKPDETAKVMLGDGWLRTGDIGRLDAAGYLFIEDRKKDVIVVSGFKVYPNEIEDVAMLQAGVRESGRDRRAGTPQVGRGREVVRRAQQRGADHGRGLAHARQHLTGYKVPRHVEFVVSCRSSNVGKVLRTRAQGARASSGERERAE
jgi:long-chain acyl-CoA synthetase